MTKRLTYWTLWIVGLALLMLSLYGSSQALLRAHASSPVILYSRINFCGALCGAATYSVPSTNGWDYLYSFNDRTSSWRNMKDRDARLAENRDGSGDHRCLHANSQGATLGTFNDEASAIKVYDNNDVCQ